MDPLFYLEEPVFSDNVEDDSKTSSNKLKYIILGLITGISIYFLYKYYSSSPPSDPPFDFNSMYHSFYDTISSWARGGAQSAPNLDQSQYINPDGPIQLYPEDPETPSDLTPKLDLLLYLMI